LLSGDDHPPKIVGIQNLDGIAFYLVKFHHETAFRLVRAAFLEYHFPMECVIFLKKRENTLEKLDARESRSVPTGS
jgi:hypothetical protein